MATRQEHDFLGTREIDEDAYYGVQTVRAVENFPITGLSIGRMESFMRAFGYVKKACALANKELG